jgi:hypothetical protein
MAPNHGAVAPHESTVGARWPGLRLLRLVPLFGVSKWHQSNNREMGRALLLGGHHLMGRHNTQQPTEGWWQQRGRGIGDHPLGY